MEGCSPEHCYTSHFRAKSVPKILTDLTIKNLPAGLHFDQKLASFGIRVGKNRKTWLVVKGPNRTKIALGLYPQVSLQDARKKAFAALASEEVKVTTLTFADARAKFLEKHGAGLRPGSLAQITNTLTRHFKWQKTLDAVTHADVAEALDKIKAPSQRAHALKDIRTFFNWCIPRYLKASPCIGIKTVPQKARDRVLTDEELAKVWHRAEAIGYPYGTTVQLLILTGQRCGEIASMKWEWIDGGFLTIPASIAKNARATTIPLGKMAQEIIESVRKVNQ